MRRIWALAAVLMVAMAGAVPAGAANQSVNTFNFSYQPNPVVVSAGDSLELRNLDVVQSGEGHSVTHAPASGSTPLFASPVVMPGQSAAVTGVSALPPGTYAFTCEVHPFMTGSLEVRAQ